MTSRWRTPQQAGLYLLQEARQLAPRSGETFPVCSAVRDSETTGDPERWVLVFDWAKPLHPETRTTLASSNVKYGPCLANSAWRLYVCDATAFKL